MRYKSAIELAGRAVLAQNPRLLLGVAGLNYSTHLESVIEDPLDLPTANLVFEAHDYSWFINRTLLHEDVPFDVALQSYGETLDDQWGHISREGHAPIIVSEFGMAHDFESDPDVSRWFDFFSDYVGSGGEGPLGGEGGLDWMYWQLSGVQAGGVGRHRGADESFGLLNRCWTGPWKASHLAALRGLGL